MELDEALVRTRDEIMKDVTTPGEAPSKKQAKPSTIVEEEKNQGPVREQGLRTKAKISTAQYMELDTIMESDGESVTIMIDTSKKDGVGEIIRRKRTPKKVLMSQAKPKEQVGNSNSKAKPQGQTTHPQVADVP